MTIHCGNIHSISLIHIYHWVELTTHVADSSVYHSLLLLPGSAPHISQDRKWRVHIFLQKVRRTSTPSRQEVEPPHFPPDRKWNLHTLLQTGSGTSTLSSRQEVEPPHSPPDRKWNLHTLLQTGSGTSTLSSRQEVEPPHSPPDRKSNLHTLLQTGSGTSTLSSREEVEPARCGNRCYFILVLIGVYNRSQPSFLYTLCNLTHISIRPNIRKAMFPLNVNYAALLRETIPVSFRRVST